MLQGMRDKHQLVSQKTGALHQACEQLMEDQVWGHWQQHTCPCNITACTCIYIICTVSTVHVYIHVPIVYMYGVHVHVHAVEGCYTSTSTCT